MRAERIPFEPEADNADEGNKNQHWLSLMIFQNSKTMGQLIINGEAKQFENLKTLSFVLNELKISSTRGIALAVNGTVVPKNEWESCLLNENDKITIIQATQGG